MSGKTWIQIGAVLGGVGVIAGAFGAHGLEGRFASAKLEADFEIAVRYQMYHALALVAVGLLAGLRGRSGGSIAVAGWSFLLGVLIFSGTLYGYALGGPRWLGAITPIGGVGLIVGWFALALAAGRVAKPDGLEV